MTPNSELVSRDRRLISNALKIRYNPLAVDHAEGVRIYDVEGGIYLDSPRAGRWPTWGTATRACATPSASRWTRRPSRASSLE